MEERKGVKSPLGVKDRRRDGGYSVSRHEGDKKKQRKKKPIFMLLLREREQDGNTASSQGCNRGYQPLKALFTMTTVNTNTT